MMIRLLVFFASALLAASGFAQQYKWVDKDGKVRYGDMPPPGVRATPLKPPSGAAAPSASSPETAGRKDEKLTPEQAFQKRQKDQQDQAAKADKASAETEARRVNCELARSNLRQLQSGERMATSNAAGERVFLDDAQRAKETDRVQKAVSDWCR